MTGAHPPTRGQRISAAWTQSVDRLAKAVQAMPSATPGLDFIVAPNGTVTDYNDPGRERIVFVLAVEETAVVCKQGYERAGGWVLDDSPVAIVRPDLAPGYRPADFALFTIAAAVAGDTNPQPGPTDQFCTIVNGVLRPHYRFKLVDPPDLSDACGTPPPAAASVPCCDDCGQGQGACWS